MKRRQVKAFHMRFGNKVLIPELKQFIKEVLRPANVELLILEINLAFVFNGHPEIKAGPEALTRDDARDIVYFAREAGLEIVPLMQCLGHQGWGGSRNALLQAYPEFDETPETSLEAEWPEIFCRSWCPLHPEVNSVVMDLIDEMLEAFDSQYYHIGMDEVFEIASEQCPRCRGKNRAELFSQTVNQLYDHISVKRGRQVMMWADRLIKADKFGYDQWEADKFGTFTALETLPQGIILLDWHYDERDQGYSSPAYLMEQGFSVMPACWYKENVAQQLFGEAKQAAEILGVPERYFGSLVTSWHHWDREAFDIFMGFTQEQQEAASTNQTEFEQLYQTLTQIT